MINWFFFIIFQFLFYLDQGKKSYIFKEFEFLNSSTGKKIATGSLSEYA